MGENVSSLQHTYVQEAQYVGGIFIFAAPEKNHIGTVHWQECLYFGTAKMLHMYVHSW